MMRVPVDLLVRVAVCDDEESSVHESRVYRTHSHDTTGRSTVRLLLSTFTHEM